MAKGIDPRYPDYIIRGIERSEGYSIYMRLKRLYDPNRLIRECEAHNAKALARFGIKVPKNDGLVEQLRALSKDELIDIIGKLKD